LGRPSPGSATHACMARAEVWLQPPLAGAQALPHHGMHAALSALSTLQHEWSAGHVVDTACLYSVVPNANCMAWRRALQAVSRACLASMAAWRCCSSVRAGTSSSSSPVEPSAAVITASAPTALLRAPQAPADAPLPDAIAAACGAEARTPRAPAGAGAVTAARTAQH